MSMQAGLYEIFITAQFMLVADVFSDRPNEKGMFSTFEVCPYTSSLSIVATKRQFETVKSQLETEKSGSTTTVKNQFQVKESNEDFLRAAGVNLKQLNISPA